ncbi:hypothetical protein QJS04_geneDACA009496 [Acorus gramineus]|uniref:Uncharacterized protein n=1 Tax=Acorus gramineus TaxID=55184 RepID=A0AAV9AH16_ACOGR|nr:hypothetical protein QJS04_geneDACA009496 [Acorus gramineus]
METLTVVSQHRNRYVRDDNIFDRFRSPPPPLKPSYMAPKHPAKTKARDLRSSEPPKKPKKSQLTPTVSKPPIKAAPLEGELGSGGGRSGGLWAGPAYSNSPPPSSLPMPKFSLRQKRSVSVGPPPSPEREIMVPHPLAKSAPASPTRDSESLDRTAATRDLRRILNLDVSDD